MSLAQRVVSRYLVALQRTPDIEDAVDHYWQSYVDEDGTLCFEAKAKKMPLDAILQWDDYSSWGEFKKGELAALSPEEAREELESFRGTGWANRAFEWLKQKKVPPIILVDGNAGQLIGDGRGRTNFAVGFGLPALNVVILKETPGGSLCFTYRDGRLQH